MFMIYLRAKLYMPNPSDLLIIDDSKAFYT
jgi:hypothetical protein